MEGGGLRLLLLLVCCLHLANTTRTHREHKIHNIVIYPDKHSWCKTTPIKQVVAWPGCVAREIDNNVCVGACFSYTIPQTEPSAPGDVISPYCDSCQPSEVTWLDVTLECTHEEEQVETLAPEPTTTPQPGVGVTTNTSTPPLLMQKRVQMITNCSCSTCHGHSHHHESHKEQHQSDSDHHQTPSLLDVPELMGLMKQVHTRKLANNHSASHPQHPHNLILPELPSDLSEMDEEEKKEEVKKDEVTESLPPSLPPVSHHVHSSEVVHHPAPAPEIFEPLAPAHETFEPLPPTHESFEPLPPAHESFKPLPPTHESFEPLPPPHEGHVHHAHHPHHPHHHAHHHGAPPAHLEVPQEKLQPAQEGAEMSYHDNLVPSDQSQEKDEEF